MMYTFCFSRSIVENEPLIPATTRFLLTTKSSVVASKSAAEGEGDVVELNESAYGRYFDRPEVQRAYREQQNIQTPEFTQVPEDAIVGGRFRPRHEEVSTVLRPLVITGAYAICSM